MIDARTGHVNAGNVFHRQSIYLRNTKYTAPAMHSAAHR